ncbi:hypothetical protein [Desulfatibacillum alkenivorans]|uniref:hypothetical protein n=1 Tax=Desulfatibacillum alkenivorans TaxID=259354 RepID=UPI00093617DA|nr:hypothetical protein [Desulfatibacillum alkenivorans]
MKTLISRDLTAIIQAWAKGVIHANQPRLCGEIGHLSKADLISIVCAILAEWKVDLFLVMFNIGSRNISYIISQDELYKMLGRQIENEGTCAFIDLKMVGGCTFDFSNDGDSFLLFIAAWGDREIGLKKLSKRRNDLDIFRGN